MTNYHNQLGTSFFTHYGYDEAGRLTIVINANNETNQFGYDAAGNMTSLTDGKGATTGWTYDIYGRLTLKQDANFHTLWTYQYFRFFRKVSPFLPTVCIRHWYGRDIAA